ncbi:MAG: tryptophan-rich sensory protein [Chloroflexota bacterium]
MDRKRIWLALAVLNVVGFLGTVVINGLANALPINNRTTGSLSDQYPNLFVPAALTFSIWGVIYILLAIFVVYSVVSALKNETEQSFLDKVGVWFFVTCIANIGWIFAWHYEIIPVSMVLMLVLLGCLIPIYLRLSVGKSDSGAKEKYLVHLPFSVYLGWITIATIANATALLVDVNWNRFGLGEQFWTAAVIIAGLLITLAILFQRKDIFYALVVDWAFLGILIKRLAMNSLPDQSVVIFTIIGLVIITLGIIIQIAKRRVYKLHNHSAV